jgi:MFS family permease
VDSKTNSTDYRWYILILAALTATFTSAAPMMCMPVLFQEISEELNLTLVQISPVWGIGALAGTLTGIVAGAISDRLGARRTLYIACMLAGSVGA